MNLEENLSPRQLLHKANNLMRMGHLTQSSRIFHKLLATYTAPNLSLTPVMHYQCLLNLSTIQIQLNQLDKAKKYLQKAIHLNPEGFQAFYNIAMVYFQSKKHYNQSFQCLKHSISILYLELGILTDSLKYLNKSISLYDRNAKAYIYRALYYENSQKIKLATNQFEKITFEHEQYGFTNATLTEIYLQKTLFFRRIGNKEKVQENLILYRKHDKLADKQKKTLPEKVAILISDQEQAHLSSADNNELIEKINEWVKEATELMKLLHEERKRLTMEEDQDGNNKAQQIIEVSQSQPSKVIEPAPVVQTQQSLPQFQPKEQESLLEQDFQIPTQHSVPHQEQNPSISVNEDEDSAILNQKIQELQRQIKQSGGNVPQIKDLSRNSEQENFLEFQITKTIEEINNQKNQDTVQQTASNLQESGKSGISQGKISSNGDIRDSISMKSKLTEAYEIGLEEIKTYKSFVLEIRSVTMFEQKGPRKDSYTKIKYLSHELLTEKCKNEKLTWNQRFEQIKIKHSTLEDYEDDEGKYELSIQVHAKEGGWLSWNNDVSIGTGMIKLTQKGATKCTLESNGKKVGMLYYKVKLQKFEEEKE